MALVLDGTNGVSGVDGTASNPAIEGTDSNTGIFYPAADTVAIGTGGAEALRVNSSQNVGIGTSSPTARLTVVTGAAGNNEGEIRLSENATYYAGLRRVNATDEFRIGSYGASQNITFYTVSSERMRLDASGNLGIGTSSPSYKIESIGATPAYFGETTTNGTRFGYASALPSNSPNCFVGWVPDTVGGINGDLALCPRTSAGAKILFFTGTTTPSERARITSGGYFWTGGYTGTYESGFGDTPLAAYTTATGNKALGAIGANASYANNVISAGCLRSASSSYWLFSALSGDGSTTVANDYEFRLRGDGNGYADGTWNNNGADYAEFFESATGTALTLGATVVLDGNKVREATDQDPMSAIMGVVRPKEPSKASMVVGNTAWNKWANKYLTDDFDRYIMEDHDVVEWTDEDGKQHSYESHNIPAGVTVPDDAVIKTHDEKGNKFQHYKLNPAWNPDVEYVNRENRPEWIIVGLVGQVKVLKGQPVNDRWIKMRDVSATVEEWMIR